MTDKPKLEDLLPARKDKPAPPIRKGRTMPNELETDMLIDVWLPHFVAYRFHINDSITAAFPKRPRSQEQNSQLAARLLKHPSFQDKFVAHIAKLDAECEIDQRFVLSGLYHQALANIFDYFKTDTDGRLSLKDISSLPIEMQRNVKKVRLENTVQKKRSNDVYEVIEQRVTFEIVDSQRAYALLGKAIGMFIERHKVDVNVNLADALQEALERKRQRMLEQPSDNLH